jgi:AraC-like DNA-binding protein
MLYKFHLQDVKLLLLGRTNENPPWRHEGRKTAYHHVVLILSGSYKCRIEHRTYDLAAGDLLYIPGEKFYKFTTKDHCEYCFACFAAKYAAAEEEDVAQMLRELPLPEKRFFLPDAMTDSLCLAEYSRPTVAMYSNLLSLFTKSQNLNMTGSYPDRLMLDAYFREILILASKSSCSTTNPTRKYPLSLERMMKYIEESVTLPTTPETLSEHFSLSKEHICALFRKELDMTVSEYVNMVKLRHAVELLSNSSMNVSQISEYLGYSSVYYFSRIFKQRYGVSPTHYGAI